MANKNIFLGLILLFLLGCFLSLSSQKKENDMQACRVKVFLTSPAPGERLAQKADCKFAYYPQPEEDEAVVFIDEKVTFQTCLGMGAAFTDASAETYDKLPAELQEEIMRAYFDPQSGIGYNLGRIPIHSSDFSSSSFTYVKENDKELKTFTVDRDLKYRIPFIKKALARANRPVILFASPWSPPAWMKTNNNMLLGGKLKPDMRQPWANYYVKFINEYEQLGIPIWGLTVQNEPMSPQRWESCLFTAEEERDFVKNHLGPTLHRNNLQNKKLMIWDHNRGLLYQRAKVVYDDPEAAKYVWGAGFHWYMGDHFDNVRMVHDAFPQKNLLFTEGCFYPFDWQKITDWNWGEKYAKSIINDFNNWAVGWTDWNLLVDEKGGPNHVKNYCYAPIVADTKNGKLHYMNSFYYIGHFSKFIRPGAWRIACSSVLDELSATAFKNPDGSLVTVVLNAGEKPMVLKLWFEAHIACVQLPAHGIVTLVIDNSDELKPGDKRS